MSRVAPVSEHALYFSQPADIVPFHLGNAMAHAGSRNRNEPVTNILVDKDFLLMSEME